MTTTVAGVKVWKGRNRFRVIATELRLKSNCIVEISEMCFSSEFKRGIKCISFAYYLSHYYVAFVRTIYFKKTTTAVQPFHLAHQIARF